MQRQIHRMPFHLSYLPDKTFSTVQVNDPEREKNKRQRLLISRFLDWQENHCLDLIDWWADWDDATSHHWARDGFIRRMHWWNINLSRWLGKASSSKMSLFYTVYAWFLPECMQNLYAKKTRRRYAAIERSSEVIFHRFTKLRILTYLGLCRLYHSVLCTRRSLLPCTLCHSHMWNWYSRF